MTIQNTERQSLLSTDEPDETTEFQNIFEFQFIKLNLHIHYQTIIAQNTQQTHARDEQNWT